MASVCFVEIMEEVEKVRVVEDLNEHNDDDCDDDGAGFRKSFDDRSKMKFMVVETQLKYNDKIVVK